MQHTDAFKCVHTSTWYLAEPRLTLTFMKRPLSLALYLLNGCSLELKGWFDCSWIIKCNSQVARLHEWSSCRILTSYIKRNKLYKNRLWWIMFNCKKQSAILQLIIPHGPMDLHHSQISHSPLHQYLSAGVIVSFMCFGFCLHVLYWVLCSFLCVTCSCSEYVEHPSSDTSKELHYKCHLGESIVQTLDFRV